VIRKDYQNLLSAIAIHLAFASNRGYKTCCNTDKNSVPSLMSMLIIDALEVVDVDHDYT